MSVRVLRFRPTEYRGSFFSPSLVAAGPGGIILSMLGRISLGVRYDIPHWFLGGSDVRAKGTTTTDG